MTVLQVQFIDALAEHLLVPSPAQTWARHPVEALRKQVAKAVNEAPVANRNAWYAATRSVCSKVITDTLLEHGQELKERRRARRARADDRAADAGKPARSGAWLRAAVRSSNPSGRSCSKTHPRTPAERGAPGGRPEQPSGSEISRAAAPKAARTRHAPKHRAQATSAALHRRTLRRGKGKQQRPSPFARGAAKAAQPPRLPGPPPLPGAPPLLGPQPPLPPPRAQPPGRQGQRRHSAGGSLDEAEEEADDADQAVLATWDAQVAEPNMAQPAR